MTKDERLAFQGLLTWRKGVLPVLKGIPRLNQRITDLEQQLNKLAGNVSTSTGKVGPLPKKEDRIPFPQICEDVEERFDQHFRAALADDELAEEWTVSDIAKRLKVSYSADVLGRALRSFEVLMVIKRRKGKTVRLYRVVPKQPEA